MADLADVADPSDAAVVDEGDASERAAAPFIPSSRDQSGLPPAPWRMFGSPEYFKLWIAQVVSSTGDWIGLVAILSMAERISSGASGVSLVMVARMVPGFILAPLAGVIVDRLDRKRLMIGCDLGRAVILGLLPLVDTLFWLIAASFVIEVLTILWGPAKDASVPNLVPREKLAAVNSLNLAAAFGTFPVGAAIFASLAKAAEWLGGYDTFSRLGASQESLALIIDGLTFVTSALLIFKMSIPGRRRERRGRIVWAQAFLDLKEGLTFIGSHRLVRAVMLGLGTGLVGGGAIIPLGKTFAGDVLEAGPSGYGLLLTGLGTGAAVGVVLLSMLRRRPSSETVFTGSVVGTGLGLLALATTSSLGPAVICVAAFGMCAGASYVAGFTVIQEQVEDELRGRTFAALYTMIRFTLILSLTVSPAISSLLDRLSRVLVGSDVTVFERTMPLPGVRLTLWAGGLLVVMAGMVTRREVRAAEAATQATQATHRDQIGDLDLTAELATPGAGTTEGTMTEGTPTERDATGETVAVGDGDDARAG